jgi:hypothetical protein
MTARESKEAIAKEAERIRETAKRRTPGRVANVWRWLSVADDLATIVLASLAAATAALQLGAVFTAVTAGLAALTSLFPVAIRPERRAARSAALANDWASLRDEAGQIITAIDGLSVKKAQDSLTELRKNRDAIRRRKLKDFPGSSAW